MKKLKMKKAAKVSGAKAVAPKGMKKSPSADPYAKFDAVFNKLKNRKTK